MSSAIIIKILAAALFIVSIIYFILCFMAYGHTLKKDTGTKLLALSPYWAVNSHIYDEYGRKVCKIGKKVFWIDIIIGVVLLLMWYQKYH